MTKQNFIHLMSHVNNQSWIQNLPNFCLSFIPGTHFSSRLKCRDSPDSMDFAHPGNRTNRGLVCTDIYLSEALVLLHQLTQYMTKDSSLNVVFLMSKQKQFVYTPRTELGIFMYWTGNIMNNLLSYYGLVDARISASEIDLHTCTMYYTLQISVAPDWYYCM